MPQETKEVGTPADAKTDVKTPEPAPQETAPADKAEPKSSAEAVVEALGIGKEEPKESVKEPAAEEKPKRKEAKEPEATPPADDIEIPKDITNAKSQERFRVLATQVKEKDTQLAKVTTEFQAVRKDVEDFRALIQESTSTPEEFAQLLDYSKAIKTGNYEHALKLLDAQRASIARAAGLEVEGVDVFAEHADIKARLDDLQLDKESALELVRRRNQEKITQQRIQAEQAQRNSVQQSEAAVQSAAAKIDQIQNQWKESDIDYRAKHPQLMARAKEIAAQYPPHLWAQALTDYYRTLSVPKPEPKPTLTPLRPSGGGGGNKTPRTSLEAVAASLGIAQ